MMRRLSLLGLAAQRRQQYRQRVALRRLALAGLALASLSAPAQAVSLTASQLNGNQLRTEFSTASLISLDLVLNNTLPVQLGYTLDADDIARGHVDFNAIIAEVGGAGIPGVHLSLAGASFSLLGAAQATSSLGEAMTTTPLHQGGLITVAFMPTQGGVVNELYLGNALADGAQDWRIGFAGLQPGDSFAMNVAMVPEPGAWALMLSGLGLLAWRQHRRRTA